MAAVAAMLDFRSERFYLLLIYKLPNYFLLSFATTGLSVHKKFKIDFQDGSHGRHLEFAIGTICLFYLQVIPILPTKFRVNWPFRSGEVQNRLSRLRP